MLLPSKGLPNLDAIQEAKVELVTFKRFQLLVLNIEN